MADFHIANHMLTAPPLAGGLYVVATPIGNLSDITLRALEVLAGADMIACEDTRVSGKLLKRYGIATPLTAYHEHNAARRGPVLLSRLRDGGSVALICDAGTPLISDPGYRLVRDARQAAIAVHPIPGATAAIAALSASGLPSDAFFFAGFLPSKSQGRRKRLENLASVPATLIFYESPNRLAASLEDMAACLGPDRQVSVCREMSKLHEEFVSGTALELAGHFRSTAVKGEIVVIVGPPGTHEIIDATALLTGLLDEMSVSRAAGEAARITGLSKRELYATALQLDSMRKSGKTDAGA
jgi:16S rRNA (cytidine1402-2'-O)-methyltransferase